MKAKLIWRFITIIFCLFAISILASCSKSAPDNEGITDITVAYYVTSAIPKDNQLVEDAINEITMEELKVRVKLLPISLGTYYEQISLMFSGGEDLDLFELEGSRFGSYVVNGQCIPLNDLLDKHGQGIKEAVGENFLEGGTVNGKIYGITSVRDIAQGVGFFIRKDYVDKYGIDINNVKTWDDVENVLARIKSEEPDLHPLIVEKNVTITPVEHMAGKDNLSDGFGVIMNYGDPFKIINWYETQTYADSVKRMRKWYNAGYISPDVANKTESISTQMRAGTGVCYFYMTKLGIENQESKANGTEMVYSQLMDPFITTYRVQIMQWGIASTSKNPEAAMKFLNYMYTDKRIVNLLDWGIEGVHYVYTNSGHITYPEGVTAENSGYNLNMSWAFGNQFLSAVWEGDDIDMWKKAQGKRNATPISKTMGFTFDSKNVNTEIAALNNIASEYRIGLETGSMDDSNLSDFITKLKKAGIDTVIAEKQRQLDEWLSAKNGE